MMKKDPENWKSGLGERTLRMIGIRDSQVVLDFGCGEGWYTVPVLRIVGEEGFVYALDMEESELDKLSGSLKSLGMKNCRLIQSDDMSVDLPDEHVDVVLLYDVFHYYYFSDEEDRRKLLRELRRVLKPEGMLSLYPKHLESHSTPSMHEAQDELEEEGFHLIKKNRVTMIHEEILEETIVMNYQSRAHSA